ncbi:MAG: hypothetical protein ACRD4O_02075 [Bryobacteraceae bacterium]
MESTFRRTNAPFGDLHDRLGRLIRDRISNGEFTERGLARLSGISQPQIHNFLKGARRLSPEFSDRLMLRLGIGILDLFETPELLEESAARATTEPAYPELGGLKKPVQSERSPRAVSNYFGSSG